MISTCELILALDVPSRDEGLTFLDKVEGHLDWVKIGLQLFTKEGPGFIEEVAQRHINIFLDLKLYDIPNTVGSTVRSLGHLPIQMLTLHASGGSEMLAFAREARDEVRPELQLLGVTVLTSFNEEGMVATGIADSLEVQVLRLARLAVRAGIDGLVCSPLELTLLRGEIGVAPLLVTPGIRPAGVDANEQKRTQTPESAAKMGASHIVVGRPILKAENPVKTITDIKTSLQPQATDS